MLETNPDPDPIRIQGFNDQKLKILTPLFGIVRALRPKL
jgi:hypothetical protein